MEVLIRLLRRAVVGRLGLRQLAVTVRRERVETGVEAVVRVGIAMVVGEMELPGWVWVDLGGRAARRELRGLVALVFRMGLVEVAVPGV